jgi:peptide/nickel transport system permease protein
MTDTREAATMPRRGLTRQWVGGAHDVRRRRIPPVGRFVLRRIVQGLLTLWAVTFLTFVCVQALPGDVAATVLRKNATPENIAALHKELHLDQPFIPRYFGWLGDMITGDFGVSTVAAARGDRSAAVWNVIEQPLTNSLLLAGITLVILIPCAVGLGTIAAKRAGRPVDHAISTISLAASAMPEFLVAAVLTLVFFTGLHWLSPISMIPFGSSPLAHPELLVLPVLTLLGVNLAYTARLVRASTIAVLQQDQVTMARLNGFSEGTVMRRNVLRNALAPSIQAVALTAQYLIGGIVIVEAVFAYPGVGQTLVKAVTTRDTQEIMVISTILAAMYIGINAMADLLVMLAVPRLRTAGR